MKREPGNLRLTVQRALLRNRLLAGLSDEAFRIIEADLEPVLLERGRELPAGDGIHFVESGVLSAFVRVPGGIDSAPVGREGAAGLGALIRGESPGFRYVVQNGGDALRIPASDLSAAILRRPDIAEHLTHHVIARMAEIAANAQAHVRLSVRQRLGRYLLAHRDRVDAPEIDLTHGILAEILGVRRASVTDAMHHLEGTGAIRNIRGRIIVHDADLLDRLCGLDAASPSRR
jgi:CRP-like cAMP-binding protein